MWMRIWEKKDAFCRHCGTRDVRKITVVQFSRREIRYRTSVWKELSLQDHCSLSGGIPWDFYQREDFEEKAKAVWIAMKKSTSLRAYCSENNET